MSHKKEKSVCFRECREKSWRRGSFTVEAAVIVPMAVIICALLIMFCFLEHDRVWFTSAACESALCGNSYSEESGLAEQEAELHAEERINDRVMPGPEPDLTVSCASKSTTVGYSASGYSMFAKWFSYKTEVSVSRVRPVSYLRTVWVARRIAGE